MLQSLCRRLVDESDAAAAVEAGTKTAVSDKGGVEGTELCTVAVTTEAELNIGTKAKKGTGVKPEGGANTVATSNTGCHKC